MTSDGEREVVCVVLSRRGTPTASSGQSRPNAKRKVREQEPPNSWNPYWMTRLEVTCASASLRNDLMAGRASAMVVQQVVLVRPRQLDWQMTLHDAILVESSLTPSNLKATFKSKTRHAEVHRCNATHATEYRTEARPSQKDDAIRIIRVYIWHGVQGLYSWNGTEHRLPVPPSRAGHGRHDVNLFMSWEPPSALEVDRVHGFDGELGYRRSAAITLPFFSSEVFSRAASALRFEPEHRRSVGIWVDNCISPMRNRLISALLRSRDLRVESYGRCQPTVNASVVEYWHERRIETNPEAQALCRTHRLLLSVQVCHL